eukprot:TRINITY_DN58874_c0_g1_i2.p1 TRINITY_DN58874_c0_g1~~TRINITY_DN58874_c0_g1_i2.p1  ORF type:complete len:119 (-),score=16.92 TRINITY_DN58874_c0_g1_i2:28-333(-)
MKGGGEAMLAASGNGPQMSFATLLMSAAGDGHGARALSHPQRIVAGRVLRTSPCTLVVRQGREPAALVNLSQKPPPCRDGSCATGKKKKKKKKKVRKTSEQ